ncbi:hypothetical protein [Streptomyces niveus]|uniref:hypothetical protein n=1 Tax=Streptomyces niveus TaxID=193462 RepID=UPI00343EC912
MSRQIRERTVRSQAARFSTSAPSTRLSRNQVSCTASSAYATLGRRVERRGTVPPADVPALAAFQEMAVHSLAAARTAMTDLATSAHH